MGVEHQDIVAQLASSAVLVAGDVMLDRYWFGQVERISPEAPVPVVAVDAVDERLGGAGNVACNIVALGGRCALLSVIGDDEAGRKVDEIAAAAGIESQWVTDRGGQTTLKLRVISRHQQLLRADFEAPPSVAARAGVVARFSDLLPGHGVVVLSDYGKGGLDSCAEFIALAARRQVPTLIDPKGDDFSRYRGAALVTPNLQEFEGVVGAVRDDEDMRIKARNLMAAHHIDKLLVTLSERGMALFSSSGEVWRRAARARQVYDVSGAGDSVIAVMAMAMAAGLDDATALALANGAASVVVSKLGAATASGAELAAALARDAPYQRAAKPCRQGGKP